MPGPRVSLQPFGDAGWRLRLPEGTSGRAVLEALRATPGVVDAIVSERHAAVTFDPDAAPAGVERAIEAALMARPVPSPPGEHVVPVRYGPPLHSSPMRSGQSDIEEVARAAGMSSADVILLHSEATYTVAVVGFLPGFAYLRGLDPRLLVPRRPSPRTRIAPMSVGLAGPYTGVYPFASPGGWNIVGAAVGFTPFDPRSGAKLALGDRVRFFPEPS